MKCGIYWSRCLCKTIIFISNTYARIFPVSLLSLLIMLGSSSLSPPTPPTTGELCLMGMNFKKDLSREFCSILPHRKQGRGDKRPHNPDHTVVSTQSSRCPSYVELKPSGVNITLSPRLSLMREIQEDSELSSVSHSVVLPRLGACPLEQLLPRFPLKAHNPIAWRKKAIPSPAFPLPLILGAHPKGIASQWGGHLQQTAANSGLPWDPAQNP